MSGNPSRASWALRLSILLVASTFAFTPARADDILNNIDAHNGQERIEPGGFLYVWYEVRSMNNDKQQGCNPADGTPLTLSILPSSAAVSATPSSLTFDACGAAQLVTITSSTPGNYRINLAESDAGGGSYFDGGATFTLHVGATEPELPPEDPQDPEDPEDPPAPADTTPPALSLPGGLTLEATGPDGALGAWLASATDETDGPVAITCEPPSGSTFPLGETLVTCAATDAAGNTATASFTVLVVDTTPPALTLPSSSSREGDTLGGARVSWDASASDLVDGAVAVTCDAASGDLFPVGTTTVTCSATDAAGNAASGSFDITVTDTTPPALTLPASWTAYATSGSGAPASWTASAYDIVSGEVAVTCDRASGSQFSPGRTTVTCSATDAAGNTGTGSFVVWITFEWCGFKQPVYPGGPSTFKLGSSIPVKFCLGGGITDAKATLWTTKLGGTEKAAISTSASSPLFFRYSDGQYIFNMATAAMGSGTHTLRVDLGDEVPHTVTIVIR